MNYRRVFLSLLACALNIVACGEETFELQYRIDSKELESLVAPDWITLCIEGQNGDELRYPGERTSKPGKILFSVPKGKIRNGRAFVELKAGGLESYRCALGEPVANGEISTWILEFYTVALEIGFKKSLKATNALAGAHYMSGSISLTSEENRYDARFSLDKNLNGKVLLISLPPGSYKALISLFAQKDSQTVEMLEFEVPLEVGDSDRRSFEISVSDHDFRGKEATKPISKDEIERLRTRPMKESAKDGGER